MKFNAFFVLNDVKVFVSLSNVQAFYSRNSRHDRTLYPKLAVGLQFSEIGLAEYRSIRNHVLARLPINVEPFPSRVVLKAKQETHPVNELWEMINLLFPGCQEQQFYSHSQFLTM